MIMKERQLTTEVEQQLLKRIQRLEKEFLDIKEKILMMDRRKS